MNSSRNNGPERRAFGRRHSNDHAIVRVQGRPPVRCTVKNISDTGALLDFGAEVWLPYNFRLAWEVGTRSEECEIKHRNGQFVVSKSEDHPKGRETLGMCSQDVDQPFGRDSGESVGGMCQPLIGSGEVRLGCHCIASRDQMKRWLGGAHERDRQERLGLGAV